LELASRHLHQNDVNIEGSSCRAMSKMTRSAVFCGVLACLFVQMAEAVELKKETRAAFDSYIDASEERMQTELQRGPFLFVDALPTEGRNEAYAQLHAGEILVHQVNTPVEGHPIVVPGGLIHDWIGVIFIPHVSLAQALAVAQDYDDYQNIYKPDDRRSRLLQRNGDNFKVFLQFYKKSLVTVVINADFDIRYERLRTDRVVSYSHSTRIAELEDVGQPDERELPVDDGHGYLWRLDSYWRLQEKDGGVYLQQESIGLSRNIPAIFAWLVNPLVRSIPRDALTNLLGATRTYIAKPDLTHR
jgi:hypothetical protein